MVGDVAKPDPEHLGNVLVCHIDVQTPARLAACLAVVATVVLAASLGVPWYRIEITPLGAGRALDVTAWKAFEAVDISLVLIACLCAVLVLIGVQRRSRTCFAAAAAAGLLAVALIVFRAFENPGEGPIGNTGNIRELAVLFGLWISLASAATISLTTLVISTMLRSDERRKDAMATGAEG